MGSYESDDLLSPDPTQLPTRLPHAWISAHWKLLMQQATSCFREKESFATTQSGTHLLESPSSLSRASTWTASSVPAQQSVLAPFGLRGSLLHYLLPIDVRVPSHLPLPLPIPLTLRKPLRNRDEAGILPREGLDVLQEVIVVRRLARVLLALDEGDEFRSPDGLRSPCRE